MTYFYVAAQAVAWWEDPQPGYVDVRLVDAHDVEWSIGDKVVCFSADRELTGEVEYPVTVFVGCDLLGAGSAPGTTRVRLWHHVEATEGETEFDIAVEDLAEGSGEDGPVQLRGRSS